MCVFNQRKKMKIFLFLLFALQSSNVIFAQDQLPSTLPGNSTPASVISLLPPTYSTFQEAYNAGTTLANEQMWADSIFAFNAALKMAQTDQQKLNAQKWFEYVGKKIGVTSVVIVTPTPTSVNEQSPLERAYSLSTYNENGTSVQDDNDTATAADWDKVRDSLKNYTNDTDPKNANCSFKELLKNPDKVVGKKVVGKFYIKLKKYTDPNDSDNYTDEPIDDTAKPSYLLYPKDVSVISKKRYFQIFEGQSGKNTYRNLAVGSNVTLYVIVLGSSPFDEKHTITKLYFLSIINP